MERKIQRKRGSRSEMLLCILEDLNYILYTRETKLSLWIFTPKASPKWVDPGHIISPPELSFDCASNQYFQRLVSPLFSAVAREKEKFLARERKRFYLAIFTHWIRERYRGFRNFSLSFSRFFIVVLFRLILPLVP